MAIGAFIFLIIFLSIYCEVIAGSMGILIPLSAVSIFYLSITFGWKKGLIISILAGTVVDMLYGRTFIVTPYLMMLTVLLSVFWLHKGDPVSILPNLIPGALAAFFVYFPLLAFNAYYNATYLHNAYLLLFSVITGGFLLPVIISVLDYLAEKQGFPLYRKAKAQALDKKEYH